MIIPNTIKMHFSETSGCKCGCSEWLLLKTGKQPNEVSICLDLESDQYIFTTICPGCLYFITNTRILRL